MQETIFDRKRTLLRKRRGNPTNEWERFYEYLVADYSTELPNTPNWEAASLFGVIIGTFDGSGTNSPVQVSPYMLHNLAACASVALRNEKDKRIDWSDHCEILQRTYTGFAHTIIRAIKEKRTEESAGKIFFGGLIIPDWFFIWARDKAVT